MIVSHIVHIMRSIEFIHYTIFSHPKHTEHCILWHLTRISKQWCRLVIHRMSLNTGHSDHLIDVCTSTVECMLVSVIWFHNSLPYLGRKVYEETNWKIGHLITFRPNNGFNIMVIIVRDAANCDGMILSEP